MIVESIIHERDGSLSYEWGDDATADDKEAIRRYGVRSGDEVQDALDWYDAVHTASSVDDLKQIQLGKHPTKDKDIGRPNPGRGQGP